MYTYTKHTLHTDPQTRILHAYPPGCSSPRSKNVKRALAVIFLSLEQSFFLERHNPRAKAKFSFPAGAPEMFFLVLRQLYSWTKWKEKHTSLVFQLRLTPDVNMRRRAGFRFKRFYTQILLIAEQNKQRQTPQGTCILYQIYTDGSYFKI